AASSWRSAQTPLPPASAASSPTYAPIPRQSLYHDHCGWLLQRFPSVNSLPAVGGLFASYRANSPSRHQSAVFSARIAHLEREGEVPLTEEPAGARGGSSLSRRKPPASRSTICPSLMISAISFGHCRTVMSASGSLSQMTMSASFPGAITPTSLARLTKAALP